MSAPIIILLVSTIGAGAWYFWARNLDLSEYHIAHGPHSGCVECEDK